MTTRIKHYAPVLQGLYKTSPKICKKFIQSAPPDLIKAVSEICLNVLRGKVKLSPKQKISLKKHRNTLRSLSKRNTSLESRRRHIQKGGFLGALLRPLLPLLGQLIAPIAKGILGE